MSVLTALRSRVIHPLPPLAGLLSLDVGVLVLVGWSIDNIDVTSLAPGLIAMMPNAAVAFILIGVALMCASIRPEVRLLRLTAGGSAALTAALGLITVLEYVLGLKVGIDQWLFYEPLETVGPWIPGRMGITQQARPAHRRERHGAQQLGVITDSGTATGIGPAVIEHVFAQAVGLEIARHDGERRPVIVFEDEMLSKPAGLARCRSRFFQGEQESVIHEGIVGLARRIGLRVPRRGIYFLERTANSDLHANLMGGSPRR